MAVSVTASGYGEGKGIGAIVVVGIRVDTAGDRCVFQVTVCVDLSVVKDIEELAAEVHREPFVYLERALNVHVPLLISRARVGVATDGGGGMGPVGADEPVHGIGIHSMAVVVGVPHAGAGAHGKLPDEYPSHEASKAYVAEAEPWGFPAWGGHC